MWYFCLTSRDSWANAGVGAVIAAASTLWIICRFVTCANEPGRWMEGREIGVRKLYPVRIVKLPHPLYCLSLRNLSSYDARNSVLDTGDTELQKGTTQHLKELTVLMERQSFEY